mgnify:CR=1 FL=1
MLDFTVKAIKEQMEMEELYGLEADFSFTSTIDQNNSFLLLDRVMVSTNYSLVQSTILHFPIWTKVLQNRNQLRLNAHQQMDHGIKILLQLKRLHP